MNPDQVAGLLMLLADLRLEVARVSAERDQLQQQLTELMRVGKGARDDPSADPS